MSQHTVGTSAPDDAGTLADRLTPQLDVLAGIVERFERMVDDRARKLQCLRAETSVLGAEIAGRPHLTVVGTIVAEPAPERLATIIPFPCP